MWRAAAQGRRMEPVGDEDIPGRSKDYALGAVPPPGADGDPRAEARVGGPGAGEGEARVRGGREGGGGSVDPQLGVVIDLDFGDHVPERDAAVVARLREQGAAAPAPAGSGVGTDTSGSVRIPAAGRGV